AVLLFFFFQAEDGIRDWSVTGVQTCALPISARESAAPKARALEAGVGPASGAERERCCPRASDADPAVRGTTRVGLRWWLRRDRSEERRVGKEGRAEWAADGEEKERGVRRR